MEKLEALKQYFCRFPLWEGGEPAVDSLDGQVYGCGIFPQGQEILKSRQDVLGNVRLRLRQTFLLRRTAPRGAEAARWLLQLQSWVLEQPPRFSTGVFGEDTQLRLEKGRLIRAGDPGTAVYEGTVIVEYTKEKESNED